LPLYVLRSKACTRTNSKVFGFLIFEEPGRDYREGERREINFFFMESAIDFSLQILSYHISNGKTYCKFFN
jgi:hypothetical protein